MPSALGLDSVVFSASLLVMKTILPLALAVSASAEIIGVDTFDYPYGVIAARST